MKHTITTPSRRQTCTPTQRRPAPLTAQARWLLIWHLQRGIVRPRLVTLALLLIWSAVLWLALAHLLSLWPVAQAAVLPSGASVWPTPTPVPSAASRVPALYQGDPTLGWDSPQQYHAWWPSACSVVALTADLRGWGTNVGVGAVLDALWNQGAISVASGLTDATALARVAEQYGYQASTFWHWSAQEVAQVTAQGVPVLALLVDARQQTPYPAFVVGHCLVMVSSSASQVEVRDSSGYHIHTLSPSLFRTLFTGVTVVIWQGTLTLPS